MVGVHGERVDVKGGLHIDGRACSYVCYIEGLRPRYHFGVGHGVVSEVGKGSNLRRGQLLF